MNNPEIDPGFEGGIQDERKTLEFEHPAPLTPSFITSSPTVGKLMTALAEATLKFGHVELDQVNPYYNSKFGSLGAMRRATVRALADEGIVVLQFPIEASSQQAIGLVTRLHCGDEFIEQVYQLPAVGKDKNGNMKYDAQTIGSAITYARRYAYGAILNLYAEEDDDGNAVSQHEAPAKAPEKKQTPAAKIKIMNGRKQELDILFEKVENMDGLSEWWKEVTDFRRKYAKEAGVARWIELFQEMKNLRKKALEAAEAQAEEVIDGDA